MNYLLERLILDHKQLSNILYRMDIEVRAYSGLLKQSPSLDKVLEIIDYIKVYPERWHHPTEDVIFGVLLEKGSPSSEMVKKVLHEHSTLELLTENLHCYLQKLAMGGHDHLKAKFLRAAQEYTRRQRVHMDFEQRELFPLVDREFSEKDWERVNMLLQKQHDSSLGELSHFLGSDADSFDLSKEEFLSLYQHLH